MKKTFTCKKITANEGKNQRKCKTSQYSAFSVLPSPGKPESGFPVWVIYFQPCVKSHGQQRCHKMVFFILILYYVPYIVDSQNLSLFISTAL